MQKRILLTGSNGLLGQKIVALLHDRVNISFLATSRGANRNPIPEGYRYESIDMTNIDQMEKVFRNFLPTDVINTAAMTQVDKCEDDRELCDEINVRAVERLCRLCKQYNTRLTHISTDFVFDGTQGPYVENDVPNPVNYYGLSKLKAEKIIAESGISYSILRTVLLYGVTPAMSRTNIVLWVKKSLENGKPIKVVNDQVRTPTLAEDLAAASVSAVMREAKGIFHISGAEMMNIIEIARKVAEYWNLDQSLITETDSSSLNQRAKRPPITGFVILKAQTELGYIPHSFEHGLGLVDRQLKALPAPN